MEEFGAEAILFGGDQEGGIPAEGRRIACHFPREKGDLPLDDSLSLFEEGTGLIRRCGAMLDEAEQQLVKLKKGPDREPQELPFEDDNA